VENDAVAVDAVDGARGGEGDDVGAEQDRRRGATAVSRSFAHLHTHTEFSMLDGAARIADVVAKAVADGQPAVGITDHGNMYGVLDFYAECRRQGVNPVVGSELYMAGESRHERPRRRGRVDDTGGDGDGGQKLYYHLTALAENDTGYRNLLKLSSRAYLEGYFYKPRVDWELLEEHHEGIIATTGCLGGVVLQALLQGDVGGATERAARLQDIFGRDSLFVEIQDHGLDDQRRTNPQLIEIARRIGAPLLATNDSHYTHQHDSVAHDALLCVQTGSTIDDPDRFKFHGDQHFLKTAAEMRQLFREVPEACDNTLWIAERAGVTIEFGSPKLPAFPIPGAFLDTLPGAASGAPPGLATDCRGRPAGPVVTAPVGREDHDTAYLRHLTFDGARRRWGPDLPPAVVERLDYELGVIAQMGFSSYFLITWDLIDHARRNGIRVGPGRGSAAGCAVAYCLWITDLDPIRYDLLFERFLNPSRISMPDIDMDFDSRYRDEMIRYAAERYGRDRVAQIVTFSTIKARAAVRDAARVLGYPYAVGDRVAKAMPPLVMGRDTPLHACLDEHPKYADGFKAARELREMYESEPDARKVIDVARGLEGLRRQDGIHAAAVVITDQPLTEYLPIQRKPEAGKDPDDAPVVTQYEMHGVEDLGLLKMDFLGLRNLDVITDTVEMVRRATGTDLDIDAVPLDDDATLGLLRRGQSIGVFQLEGGPMRALMRSLAPTSFDDVAALVALYRPGPMAANMHNDYADRKNGRKPITYLHPDLEEVLGDTQGLMIYQEQVMRVAQRFAGYSLAEADNLRKACLPAGSLVLTKSRGYVPIERLASLADRRVHTIDTTSSTSRFEAVEDVWPVGRKEVFRLTTSTGYSIEATDNHPLLVEDEWRPLGSIRPGDAVGVAGRTMTDGGSKVSLHEVELAALLISEGYTPDLRDGRHRVGFFCNTDPELVETFRDAFEEHVGYAHERSTVVGGVTRLRLTETELLSLESVLGDFGLSADRHIPLRYVNAPLPEVERFLGLYFCADGWADRSGAHFGSKSRRVCLGLKRMLLRCGILAHMHRRVLPVHGQHWTLSLADEGQAKAFARLVEPHLTTATAVKVQGRLTEWCDGASATNIGIPSAFLRRELERRPRVPGRSERSLGVDTGGDASSRMLHRRTLDGLLHSERLEDLRTGDLVWDTVVSVEPVGVKECFDFRMANDERPYAVVEDFLVHNCGKKIRELIAKEREKFVEGCDASGYGRELGTALFDIIEPFADYAFNKSHSYGYGLVAYQTAYLKAHHPVEYLAALLTSVKADQDKSAVYLNECRQLGIPVLVPDVNLSASDFTARYDDEGVGTIPFGLSAVRNVGEGLVALIVAEREAGGPFADFYDFCERVDPQVLNKRAVESLVKAGAFDCLGHPRKGLLLVFDQIVERTLARRRERDQGVMSLFGEGGGTDASFDERVPVPDQEFDKMERLAFEKEMLGLYVSDHPLMGVEHVLARRTDCSITELREGTGGAVAPPPEEGGRGGSFRTVGGVVTNLARKYTKKGDLMAIFVLEDLQAAIEVMVFPKTMASHGASLTEDAVVCVRGRLDTRDDVAKLIAHEIAPVEIVHDGGPPLRLSVPPAALDEHKVDELKRLLVDHPGDSPVFLHVGSTVLRLPPVFNVDTGNGLAGELRVLLGADALL
jgi:DNA-directed DNA polymerase III PolC